MLFFQHGIPDCQVRITSEDYCRVSALQFQPIPSLSSSPRSFCWPWDPLIGNSPINSVLIASPRPPRAMVSPPWNIPFDTCFWSNYVSRNSTGKEASLLAVINGAASAGCRQVGCTLPVSRTRMDAWIHACVWNLGIESRLKAGNKFLLQNLIFPLPIFEVLLQNNTFKFCYSVMKKDQDRPGTRSRTRAVWQPSIWMQSLLFALARTALAAESSIFLVTS